MRRGTTKVRNKKQPEIQLKNLTGRATEKSRQIQDMQTELKTDPRIVKEEITTRMINEVTELKDDIEYKFAEITTELGERRERKWTRL